MKERALLLKRGALLAPALLATGEVLVVRSPQLTRRCVRWHVVRFTMSQAGMVVHWHHRRVHGPRLWINAIGAAATGATAIIVIAAKFVEGAWISLVIIGAFVSLFASLRRHHESIEEAIHTDAPIRAGHTPSGLALVPLGRWDKVTSRTLRWALAFAQEVVAVQVLSDEHAQDDLGDRWRQLVEEPLERAGHTPPRLVVLRSDLPQFLAPLAAYIERRVAEDRCREVAVILPQLAEHRWYHALVPFDLASLVKAELLARGGPAVVIVRAPPDLRECGGPATSS
jgi:hypothetical protein